MLETRTLFFCTTRSMIDPYEGRRPRHAVFQEAFSRAARCRQVNWTGFLDVAKEYVSMEVSAEHMIRHEACLSCWHESPHESAAMWELYSKESGVAIRTTFEKLAEALHDSLPTVFIGRVKYIDYERDLVPGDSLLLPLFHKRKSFEYEQEVRAVTMSEEAYQDGVQHGFQGAQFPGVGVPINVEKLIDRLYLSPTTPEWRRRVVEAVVKRYALECPIEQSSLYGPEIR